MSVFFDAIYFSLADRLGLAKLHMTNQTSALLNLDITLACVERSDMLHPVESQAHVPKTLMPPIRKRKIDLSPLFFDICEDEGLIIAHGAREAFPLVAHAANSANVHAHWRTYARPRVADG